ncbi:MAG: FkbM family methyltransferase, partial [Acetobacteraceae bacterium]|nr:FkbM family methyltransferase [Acetobacteraceae bacterium]
MKLSFLKPVAQPWQRGYEPAANESDIVSCFRLLLGRAPNREEWRGHVSRVGEPLAGVVASYLNSLEFTRRGLLAQDALRRVETSQLEGFAIFTYADDAAIGRHVSADNYERDVTAVIRRLLRPGMGVIDVGANIGYFTMLAASLVGSTGYVIAIEPNPDNAKLLEASRRANGFSHVTVCQTAAGRDTGLL